MRPELEDRIFARWPDWFDDRGDVRKSLMGFGFQHGDGWYELLLQTFERIEPEVERFNQALASIGTRFKLLEVKEKFGELRTIAMPTTQAITFAFMDARFESLTICELCGAPSELHTAYSQNRCTQCAGERG